VEIMEEARKDKRVSAEFPVRVKSATVGEFVDRLAADVSIGGIFIQAEPPLDVGTLVRVEFHVEDGTQLCTGVGRVVWNRGEDVASAERPVGMGVKFVRVDTATKEVLASYVEQRASEVSIDRRVIVLPESTLSQRPPPDEPAEVEAPPIGSLETSRAPDESSEGAASAESERTSEPAVAASDHAASADDEGDEDEDEDEDEGDEDEDETDEGETDEDDEDEGDEDEGEEPAPAPKAAAPAPKAAPAPRLEAVAPRAPAAADRGAGDDDEEGDDDEARPNETAAEAERRRSKKRGKRARKEEARLRKREKQKHAAAGAKKEHVERPKPVKERPSRPHELPVAESAASSRSFLPLAVVVAIILAVGLAIYFYSYGKDGGDDANREESSSD
jgi:uncharacterized protein (TIGR02266 family)